VPFSVKDDGSHLELATAGITVSIDKQPFRISYTWKGRPLIAEKLGYTHADGSEALEFALDGDEALYGASARAVGMNQRRHRFKLYNKAHYGYGNYSEQLNFAIPMALSSKRYAIHFDNPQVGYLDFDSRKNGTLRYEVAGGCKTYQVMAGDSCFGGSLGDGRLEIRFDTETGQHYRPAARTFALKVHRVATRPRALTVDGRGAPFRWDAGGKLLEVGVPLKPGQPKKVVVAL
jgi:alpha-glucosidase (family GH31 glycosyl hydrolase)